MELFELVERSAIVVKPKQRFWDWVKSLDDDPNTEIDQGLKTGDVYLMKDCETEEEMERWLKRNCRQIFDDNLSGWYLDESLWPQKRSFSVFREWFDYSCFPIVNDLLPGPIGKL